MLAQSFKSAADLGLDEQEKAALVKTLVLLETGKLIHTPYYISLNDDDDGNKNNIFTGHFCMSDWGTVAKCGTIACIGGTAELVGNLEKDQLMDKAETNKKLDNLFYPILESYSWRHIKPAQAARALRSYLTTGEAHWELAFI